MQIACHGVTSSRNSNSRDSSAARRECRWRDQRCLKCCFREVSAYSTDLPEKAQGDPQEVPWSSDRQPNGWKGPLRGCDPEPAVGMKPQCVRKACNLPASPRSLTASCHLTHVSKAATSEPPRFIRYATIARLSSRSPNAACATSAGSSHLVFLLFKTTRHGCPVREIST